MPKRIQWEKKRKNTNKNRGANKNYSILNKLRKENKTSEEFEIMMNNLSLEELIAAKLELATKPLQGRLYGFNLWYVLKPVVDAAALIYSMSATRTKTEAMKFMGLDNKEDFKKLLKKYNIEDYFQ
tara:strand:+ start:162 stop:539 length:378 start_codon:yes stop_codon:yes gene_type:complete